MAAEGMSVRDISLRLAEQNLLTSWELSGHPMRFARLSTDAAERRSHDALAAILRALPAPASTLDRVHKCVASLRGEHTFRGECVVRSQCLGCRTSEGRSWEESSGIGSGGGREERLLVPADDLVEDGAFRLARRVPRGRDGRTALVSLRAHEPTFPLDQSAHDGVARIRRAFGDFAGVRDARVRCH